MDYMFVGLVCWIGGIYTHKRYLSAMETAKIKAGSVKRTLMFWK